jgi:hypothetical protein
MYVICMYIKYYLKLHIEVIIRLQKGHCKVKPWQQQWILQQLTDVIHTCPGLFCIRLRMKV